MQLFELVEIKDNEENLPKVEGEYLCNKYNGHRTYPAIMEFTKNRTSYLLGRVHSYYQPITEITHKDGAAERHSWVTGCCNLV